MRLTPTAAKKMPRLDGQHKLRTQKAASVEMRLANLIESLARRVAKARAGGGD